MRTPIEDLLVLNQDDLITIVDSSQYAGALCLLCEKSVIRSLICHKCLGYLRLAIKRAKEIEDI